MTIQRTHYCRVCGLPVDPQKDIAFGAMGKPLFAAHSGKCAATVRQGAGLVGKTLRGLLAAKAPRASMILETVAKAAMEHRHEFQQGQN